MYRISLDKRGQIAAFLIAGLVVLILAGLFFAFKGRVASSTIEQETQSEYTSFTQSSQVRSYAQNCFNKVTKEAVLELGVKGSLDPEEYLGETSRIAMFYYERRNLAPSVADIEKQLSDYVKSNVVECVDVDFLADLGVEVEIGNPKVQTTITEDNVIFEMDLPITVKSGTQKDEFRKFQAEVDVRLSYINEVYQDIVEGIIENPSSVDLTALLNYDVDVSIINIGYLNNLDLYLIRDFESSVYDDGITPYKSFFFVYYGGPFPALAVVPEEMLPVINVPDTLTAESGEFFSYAFDVTYGFPENLFYVIETDLDGINPYANGIYFTPTDDQIGTHEITIKVQDVRAIEQGYVEKKIQLVIQ